jgi:hypothetical protein
MESPALLKHAGWLPICTAPLPDAACRLVLTLLQRVGKCRTRSAR